MIIVLRDETNKLSKKLYIKNCIKSAIWFLSFIYVIDMLNTHEEKINNLTKKHKGNKTKGE